MNKELGCIIDLFCNDAEVIYPDGFKEKIPFLGMLEYLYQIALQEKINLIHLFGNKKYLDGLLEQYPPIEYGCGKVEIKVN